MAQLRGALLEEVVIALLRRSGFDIVENPGDDPTLTMGAAGLRVLGRGTTHQADALADFRIIMPFGNPTRLIVEAKCLDHNKTGLTVMRNAVGVIKDLEEFFVPSTCPNVPQRARFHYQYAVFSVTEFTSQAQRYAYAHDIYLFPLARSRHMRRIIDIIRSLEPADFPLASRTAVPVDLGAFRRGIREALKEGLMGYAFGPEVPQTTRTKMRGLVNAVRSLGGTLLARANRRFPLHLVPETDEVLSEIARRQDVGVRIFYDDSSWYLQDVYTGNDIFSFDLPEELFLLYAESGVLSREAALDVKEQHLSEIQAVYSDRELTRHIVFRLDRQWLDEVRHTIQTRRRRA